MDDEASEIGTPAWREAVAALSMGVAAIHFSLVPAQFGIDTAYGAGLVLAGWLSVVVSVALLVQRSRIAAVAVLVVHTALVGAWLVVHTIDVPFGPASGGPARDPGAADTIAMLLGVLAILCAGALLIGLRPYLARPVVGGVALGSAATLALVGSIFGIAESATADAGGHPHAAVTQDGG